MHHISLNKLQPHNDGICTMITSGQMRAARALLGIDQRELARRCKLSLPTIQRMEASGGVVRGNVDSLMKLVESLTRDGIDLISDSAPSATGGQRAGHRENRRHR